MKEIVELRPGDIVKLETNANDEILIAVENKPMFYGKVGRKGKKKAVKVTNVLKKTDESYEKKYSVK